MVIYKLIFPLLFVFLISVTFSQNLVQDHSNFKDPVDSKPVMLDTSAECDIMLTNSELLKGVEIIAVGDSTFTITKFSINKVFPISQLHKVKFIRNNFWSGFAAGAIGSVAFLTAIGLIASSKSKEALGYGFLFGLMFAAPVGLITGIIAEFAGQNNEYNFANMNSDVKAKRLKYIISKNK